MCGASAASNSPCSGNAKEASWVDVTSAMGEDSYNKHWACSKLDFAPADAWRVHYFCIGFFALTLSMLLTSEPARRSFQVMSWICLSCHCLMNGPSSLSCALLNALLLPARPPLENTFCYSSLFSSWLSNGWAQDKQWNLCPDGKGESGLHLQMGYNLH